jgi:peptide/nickel transport system permease protein
VRRYLLIQVGSLLAMLLVASFIVFSLVYLSPGDAVSALLGNQARNPARVAQLRAEYHLDKPFFEQYWIWLSNAVHGDFGKSTVDQEPVGQAIVKALPVTLWLIVLAEGLTILISLAAATIAACFKGVPDTVISLGASAGSAIPSFVAATVLSIIFAVNLKVFPVLGAGHGFTDRLWHLALPAIALAIAFSALLTRVARASMREELASDHVNTEITRGIRFPRVFRRHVLRNSAPPLLAVIGLQIPGLIAGTVVVEQVFNLNGVGALLLSGVNSHDFPLVQAITLLMVATVAVTGMLVDLAHVMLDPRVRLGERA